MKINGKELRDEGGKDTVVVCVFGEYMSLSVSGAEGFELVLDLLEDACAGLLEYCKDHLS